FLHHLRQARIRNFKSKSGTKIIMLASAPLLPKFVSGGAAMYHELRKRGTSARPMIPQSIWARLARRLPVAAVASLFTPAAGGAGAQAAETVSFPGKDVTLNAILHRPAGAGPFPAVVALHGCAGLFGKDGGLAPRHADWAERLAAEGFIVLFPDSFGSR